MGRSREQKENTPGELTVGSPYHCCSWGTEWRVCKDLGGRRSRAPRWEPWLAGEPRLSAEPLGQRMEARDTEPNLSLLPPSSSCPGRPLANPNQEPESQGSLLPQPTESTSWSPGQCKQGKEWSGGANRNNQHSQALLHWALF